MIFSITDNDITYNIDLFTTDITQKKRTVHVSINGEGLCNTSVFYSDLVNNLSNFLTFSNNLNYRDYSLVPYSDYFVFDYIISINETIKQKIVESNLFEIIFATMSILTQDIYRYRVANVNILNNNNMIFKFIQMKNYSLKKLVFDLSSNTCSYYIKNRFILSILQAITDRTLPFTTTSTDIMMERYVPNISVINY